MITNINKEYFKKLFSSRNFDFETYCNIRSISNGDRESISEVKSKLKSKTNRLLVLDKINRIIFLVDKISILCQHRDKDEVRKLYQDSLHNLFIGRILTKQLTKQLPSACSYEQFMDIFYVLSLLNEHNQIIMADYYDKIETLRYENCYKRSAKNISKSFVLVHNARNYMTSYQSTQIK